jgi:hypothetical protein
MEDLVCTDVDAASKAEEDERIDRIWRLHCTVVRCFVCLMFRKSEDEKVSAAIGDLKQKADVGGLGWQSPVQHRRPATGMEPWDTAGIHHSPPGWPGLRWCFPVCLEILGLRACTGVRTALGKHFIEAYYAYLLKCGFAWYVNRQVINPMSVMLDISTSAASW